MLGLHVSIADSLDLAVDRASEVGATTFQIFTRNPNQWKFNPLADETIKLFKTKRKEAGFRRIVDHMPYLPNLASPLGPTMKISRYTLQEELKRCDALAVDYLVAHLGSHLGSGIAVGVRNVAEACNLALAQSSGESTILLENMAGQKNSVGSRFEELRLIIDKVEERERVGVCFDSCHAFASGFDLSSKDAVERSMEIFNESVGNEFLKVVHLNDSKGTLGAKLDRHEFVGEGKIGTQGLRAFLKHRWIRDKPIIMETPYDDLEGMKRSMAAARKLLR
ncbi:MAG: deoxyribonuclease IV [Thaumarchaeota archaeon]|nr:deoxyribonuclease IV [Nitrososphaerota archaeon]